MNYRYMGNTGLPLSELSLGTWLSTGMKVDEKQFDHLTGTAYDAGINFFDNAEVYADGESERVMGKVFAKKSWDRSSYILSSKVYFGAHGAATRPSQKGLNRKHIIEGCEEALQRLKTDYLDLYFCHRPDPNVAVAEIVWAMNILINQGKILYWGTSEWSAQAITEAHYAAARYNLIGPSMEQPQYNLFYRDKMELDYLPLFKQFGMGTTTWSPLASGMLTGKYNKGIPEGSRLTTAGFSWLKDVMHTEKRIGQVNQLMEIAATIGCTPAALAIAWCLKNPNASTVLLGASTTGQLEDNLKAATVAPLLDAPLLAALDTIFESKPESRIF